MKWARVRQEGGQSELAGVIGESVVLFREAIRISGEWPQDAVVPNSVDALIGAEDEILWRRAAEVVSRTADTPGAHVLDARKVRFLAPLQRPSKMLCVGGNYPVHRAGYEMKREELPGLFQKPSSAIIGPGDDVQIPREVRYCQPELELCAVIGKTSRHLEAARAESTVFGYTIGNEITATDLLFSHWAWRKRPELESVGVEPQAPLSFGLAFQGKSYDTFAPMGPWVVTVDEVDWRNLTLQLTVNGSVVQEGPARDMLFSVGELIAFASSVCTLFPGDVVWTGAAAGKLTALRDGDRLVNRISGIGEFENMVRQL